MVYFSFSVHVLLIFCEFEIPTKIVHELFEVESSINAKKIFFNLEKK